MRMHKLAYEIEQRLPPPPKDSMTVEEFGHLLVDSLARAVSNKVAQQWVREHLRPARANIRWALPVGKSDSSGRTRNAGSRKMNFANVLADAKIKVVGDAVHAAEIRS